MMYGQYLRAEQRAGGVTATPRQFVKACHELLNKRGKSFQCRKLRHMWLRDGLVILARGGREYNQISGRLG